MHAAAPSPVTTDRAALVVVDMQQKLFRAMPDPAHLQDRAARLVQGAALLGVPVAFFEQNPRGIGTTLPELQKKAPDAPTFSKQSFSGHLIPDFRSFLTHHQCDQILICGMETHVCVAQTAMGLAREGFCVHLAIDACSSRSPADHQIGILRMQTAGVCPASAEGLLFELMERADLPKFKEFLEIVK